MGIGRGGGWDIQRARTEAVWIPSFPSVSFARIPPRPTEHRHIHDMPTTVVLGAGIIGLSTAHSLAALAPPDHRVHVVEPAPRLFSSASGKAAGFIAKDWFAPAIASLGLLSFDLHRDLAQRYNGRARWAYSESISYSLDHNYDAHSDTSASAENIHVAPARTQEPSDDHSTEAQHPTVIDDHRADASGRNDSQGESGLDWLLNNQTRATAAASETSTGPASEVAPSPASEGATATRDDVPRWLRARPEALEAISDKTSTAQV